MLWHSLLMQLRCPHVSHIQLKPDIFHAKDKLSHFSVWHWIFPVLGLLGLPKLFQCQKNDAEIFLRLFLNSKPKILYVCYTFKLSPPYDSKYGTETWIKLQSTYKLYSAMFIYYVVLTLVTTKSQRCYVKS